MCVGTSKELPRLTLSRKANGQYMLQQIRAIVSSAGVCRHVTEMSSIVVHDVDPLVREEDLTTLLDSKFESGAGIVSTTMTKMSDGTQRAYVRLPAKFAKELVPTTTTTGHQAQTGLLREQGQSRATDPSRACALLSLPRARSLGP